MTTDTLGPCPPQRPAKHMFVGYEERACVSTDYADWQRRRAERAEGLLREAAQEGGPWDVESWVKRVAAHFDAVGRKP